MIRKLTPWAFAIAAMLLAMFARYVLIQPPEVAHQCDVGGPWWCTVRYLVILSYAWYGLGYAAFVLSLCALVLRSRFVAALTLATGFCALVLYCYEPGAVAVVVGVLRLARLSRTEAHAAPQGPQPTHA